MPNITIELSSKELQYLKEAAERKGVRPGELAHTAVLDLLDFFDDLGVPQSGEHIKHAEHIMSEARSPHERARLLEQLASSSAPTGEFLETVRHSLPVLSSHPVTANRTAHLLAKIEEPGASKLLRKLQAKLKWTDRIKLIELLEAQGDHMARNRLVPIIRTACDEPLPNVACAGIDALCRLTSGSASPTVDEVLLHCLQSRFEDLSLAALQALGEIGSLQVASQIRSTVRGRHLKHKVEEVLNRIRERYGISPGGALSVLKRQAGGELSLNDTAGAVSLAALTNKAEG